MKGRNFHQFSYIFFCIVFLHNSVSAQMPTPTPETVSEVKSVPKTELNLIHSGDLIDVDVVGSLEYDWRGTLTPDGFLDGIELVENPVYALCRSEEAIAEAVAKSYGKFLREPKIIVKILDRSKRPLSVLYGAVKTPQRFQIKRPIFLNELIIVAGGLTEKASGEIQIFRLQNLNCQQEIEKLTIPTADGEKPEKFITARQDNGSNYLNIRISDLLAGKKEANPQILSGDIVTVQEAESIYVIGGVANPKQVATRGLTTLSRAVASAGGVIKGGDASKITIFRREAGETKIIEADLEKIKANKADDLILKAFDIVEVTQSGGEPRKFPPILTINDPSEKIIANLPLRIIE